MWTREQRIALYVAWIRWMLYIALAAVALVFLFALGRHPHESALLRLQAPPSGDGHLQVIDGPAGPHHLRLLVFWQDGRLRVYGFPYADDLYVLPEHDWWSVGGMCARLKLQRDQGWIGCDDGQPAHRWHLDGRAFVAAQPELLAPALQPDGHGAYWVELPSP